MPAHAIAHPKRILVIRLQHHGDVLLTTPIFSTLKRHFPGAQIDAMVFAETVPMIAAHPDLTHIWPLPRSKDAGKGLARLLRQFHLMRQIRQRHYDWVLHLNDRWPGAWAALASGAPLRVSYDIPKRNNPLWKSAFPLRLPPMNHGHTVERNLAFLHGLGLPPDEHDGRCHMAFSEQDCKIARSKLADIGIQGPYILVQPTSRWFFKCWEDERFAEVLHTLAQEGYQIVLTAAPAARELALIDRLKTLAPHPAISSLAGQLSLPVLAAVIAGARLFVGVDSAPMHMAAALDTPCVALFGPTEVEAWRPWSKKATVIHAADFGPLIKPYEVDTDTEERYLSNIPVHAVLDAIRSQLAQPGHCG